MAVKIETNLNDVLKGLAKFGITNQIAILSRQAMRKRMVKYKPAFKNATPVKTGAARKSIQIKSRTKRGVSIIRFHWNATTRTTVRDRRTKDSSKKGAKGFRESFRSEVDLPYMIPVNWNKNKKAKGAGFATKLYKRIKPTLDRQVRADIRAAFVKVAQDAGMKVV